jgi:hypothetical protein
LAKIAQQNRTLARSGLIDEPQGASPPVLKPVCFVEIVLWEASPTPITVSI